MIVEPLKRQTKRRVGLVIGADRVITIDGISALRDLEKDYALYAYRHRDIWKDIRNERGKARFWKKRYTGYVLDDRKVYATRDVLSDLEPFDAFDALATWAEWAQECGANISSFASTAWSLWRASLPHRLLLASNSLPMPRDNLLIGGRQDATQGVYEEAESWDINGAYQSAMSEIKVAARYRHLSRAPIRLEKSAWKDCVGFARAEIYLTGAPFEWGPLPEGETRITNYPRAGRCEGIYDLEELRLAQECGARVYISEAWVGRGIRFPWRQWSELLSTGRALPGKAGTIAKVMGNSLWGAFSVSGRGAWVSYAENRPIVERDEREKVAPCRPLSAHISAFIRTRLYREAMAHYSAGPFCISAHTDGAIFVTPGYPNGPRGGSLGEWRRRAQMQQLVLLTAQAYKYRDATTGETAYVVAGTPHEYAPQVFRAILQKAERKRLARRLPRLLDFGAYAVE